ncbi:MAG: amidohydrolase family protein [Pseudomonadota bacterium]
MPNSADIIIKNACVITGKGPVYPDGFIHISGGRISEVGPNNPKSQVSGLKSRVIDAGGRYVLPGFINPHMHLYSALARGMPVGRMPSFGRILEGLWWKLDRALSPDDIRISALLGGISSIRSGVTTLIDHHASYGAISGSLGSISEALAEIGVRASLCFEISDRAGKRARDEALAESGLWLENAAHRRERAPGFLQRGMVGLHASMTLSDGTLDAARELMGIYEVGAHVHVAEGVEDVKATKKLNGSSPVARLAKRGILRPDSLAVHCVHADSRDIAILKASGATAVHCPLSNLGNAVGIAPFLEMRRRNIPVAVGTDGMSAGIAGDLRLASVLHRIGARDAQAGALEARDALWDTAPEIVSDMFGLKVGSIEKGAAADVIISNAIPPTEITSKNAWWHCLFGALDAEVRTAIVGGAVRMRDFKIAGVDEELVAKEARKLAKQLWRRI